MISLKTFLDEGVFDPSIFKAIFLAGGPGSGKSYIAGKTTVGFGLKLVNSDEKFEILLNFYKNVMDICLIPSTNFCWIFRIR